MLQLLESSNDIRKALGDCYDLIECFAKRDEEDRLRRQQKERLLRKYPHRCASCGRDYPGGKELQAAHILAREEGGEPSEKNFVLLCYNCHELYESGCASLNEMEKTAECWRNGEVLPLEEKMLARRKSCRPLQATVRPLVDLFKEDEVYNFVQKRWWLKALKALSQAKRFQMSNENRLVITIVQAQIHRRRAAQKAVEKAAHLLEEIDSTRLQNERLPFYFYELGYVKQLQGLTLEAGDCFLTSCKSASALNDEYAPLEEVIGHAQYLATEVIRKSALSLSDPGTAASIIEGFDTEAERAARCQAPFGERWELNCKLWKINLLLKCKNLDMASRYFEEATELRYSQNVTTGWTVDARPTMATMRGLLYVLQSDVSNEHIEQGLRFLALALVPLLGGRSQRAEGIRDKLLGFETGLDLLQGPRQNGYKRGVEKIGSVRQRIKEGSSFLDPYQAKN